MNNYNSIVQNQQIFIPEHAFSKININQEAVKNDSSTQDSTDQWVVTTPSNLPNLRASATDQNNIIDYSSDSRSNQIDLSSTTGNNITHGGAGGDVIYGGAGEDLIYGGEGDDYLDGGPGNDIIITGSGSNEVTGGQGIDKLKLVGSKEVIARGDEGSDTFVIRPTFAEKSAKTYILEDFDPQRDILQINLPPKLKAGAKLAKIRNSQGELIAESNDRGAIKQIYWDKADQIDNGHPDFTTFQIGSSTLTVPSSAVQDLGKATKFNNMGIGLGKGTPKPADLPGNIKKAAKQAVLDFVQGNPDIGVGFDFDKVVSFEKTTFEDSSLGLPKPNQSYTQVTTPGYSLKVRVTRGIQDTNKVQEEIWTVNTTIDGKQVVVEPENITTGKPKGLPVAAENTIRQKLEQIMTPGGPVRLDSIEGFSPIIFPNTALGVPEEGVMYAQMETPGYQVKVKASASNDMVSVDGSRFPRLNATYIVNINENGTIAKIAEGGFGRDPQL